MPKVLPLKIEIENALSCLRRRSNGNRYLRAALRLERMSQGILNPQPKAKRVTTQNARLRSGSGRYYPITIALSEDETK